MLSPPPFATVHIWTYVWCAKWRSLPSLLSPQVFYEASVFSGDLSSWDVSSVTTMRISEYAAVRLVSLCVCLWAGCGDGCVWSGQGTREGLVRFFCLVFLQLPISPFCCVMGKKNILFFFVFVVFYRANSCNSDLTSWDVSKVIGMEYSEYATCLLQRCCLSVCVEYCCAVCLFVCGCVCVFVGVGRNGLWICVRVVFSIKCECFPLHLSQQYISERTCGAPSDVRFLLCCPPKCFSKPLFSTVTYRLGMYPVWRKWTTVSMMLRCLCLCVCLWVGCGSCRVWTGQGARDGLLFCNCPSCPFVV